jgi:hypothetical protein
MRPPVPFVAMANASTRFSGTHSCRCRQFPWRTVVEVVSPSEAARRSRRAHPVRGAIPWQDALGAARAAREEDRLRVAEAEARAAQGDFGWQLEPADQNFVIDAELWAHARLG